MPSWRVLAEFILNSQRSIAARERAVAGTAHKNRVRPANKSYTSQGGSGRSFAFRNSGLKSFD